MRAIQKLGNGGHHLNNANANPPSNAQQATSRWSSFNHKGHVLRSLLTEQFALCCYSELRADEEKLDYHIEHVENKSQNPARTFDYGNLGASALHSDALGTLNPNEVFGGHAPAKRQGCNMARFVSCHQPDCGRFFSYLSDGRVVPSLSLTADESDRAQYTIDILNLNSSYLVNRRRQWWDELDKLFQEHVKKGWSLEHLVSIDLVPTNGKLSRFFSLTRQFFGDVAEQVLQQQAPYLT